MTETAEHGALGGARKDTPERDSVTSRAKTRMDHLLADVFARRRGTSTRVRAGDDRRVTAGFRCAVHTELAYGRGFVWAVVAFVLGVAVYFHLPAEPLLAYVMVICACLWGLVVYRRMRGLSGALALGTAMFMSGIACATLRTVSVDAPVLERARSADVAGYVEAVDRRENGYRIKLRVAEISGLRRDVWPKRVRVLVRGATSGPPVGTAVRLRARLMPPPRAVMPAGYDFSRRAFFQGIGATGFAFGPPRSADLPPVTGWLAFRAGIEHVRHAIAQRIFEAMGHETAGALAVALIVGDRSAIPAEVTEALRTAGLAHILAISGLHMALFSGAVFLVLRGGLALSSRLALNQPIDLWAAGGALIAATFYLAISGGAIATQRAYVMIVLVLVARMLGRRALTLRNVALAALAILALMPEALLEPGFQMSFAAVIALIAAYEEMLRRRVERGPRPEVVRSVPARLTRVIAAWLGGILLTSIIAGAATGAIGAYHFHRVAPLGPLINLFAMPIVSLAVMPLAVLALALMPLGLELAPLFAMGMALDQVVFVSHWARTHTPAGGVLGTPSTVATLLIVVVGGGWMCLAPRGYRRLAIVAFLGGSLAQGVHVRPDILIADSGRALAVRDRAGHLRVSGRSESFLAEVWLKADGVASAAHVERRLDANQMICDDMACLIAAHARAIQDEAVPGALTISLVRDARVFAEDCRRVDIIVSPLQAPANCAASHVYDGPRLARTGAVALYLSSPAMIAPAIPDEPDLGATPLTTPSSNAVQTGPKPFPTVSPLPIINHLRVSYTHSRPWHLFARPESAR